MKRKQKSLCLVMILLAEIFFRISVAKAAEGTYTDTRFQGVYSTENLDVIIEAYELFDGWYWSTQLNVTQNYHGQEGKKGWTQTSKDRFDPFIYSWGWFGCRWNWDMIESGGPNRAGWGECFGFAQFLGYLLSGSRNPHGEWVLFQSLREAQGLKPGDIVPIAYSDEKGSHQHSAMVYSVEGDTVLFLQASGSNYNKLYTRHGFCGAGLNGSTSIAEICATPGLRILRAEENLDGVYPYGWQQ